MDFNGLTSARSWPMQWIELTRFTAHISSRKIWNHHVHLPTALERHSIGIKGFQNKGLNYVWPVPWQAGHIFWGPAWIQRQTREAPICDSIVFAPHPLLWLYFHLICVSGRVVCTGFNQPAWWRESKRSPRTCPTWPSEWSRYCSTARCKGEVQRRNAAFISIAIAA